MNERQQQELEEERQQEALACLYRISIRGCLSEACLLAAQLGLTEQFKKELGHEGNLASIR